MNSSTAFRNFTRMIASAFELLLQLIGPRIKNRDTNMREDIPINMHLAVTIRFLTTGDSYRTLLYAFRISVSNIDYRTKSVPIYHITDRICEGK
jgi:hypothetical protein